VSAHKGRGIEAVVGIGGGSAIDAAKAVAALLPFGNSVMDHLEVVGRGIPYEGPSLPCVAVPTTAGTGSEATKNAVLASRGPEGFKRSFRHEALVPAVAVVDPTLTYDCPPELTASAGMDALTQLLESYVSTGSNPFTDGLAMSGLTAARDGLLAAYENGADESARRAMAYAAIMSGITLAQAGLGVVHGLASPLGGFFPIPHGVACAALLVPATKVNIKALRERSPDSAALEKYAEAGAILSGAAPAGREAAWGDLIDTLSFWKERLRIPRLGAYGVEERDLRKIAAAYSAKTNPATLMEEELAAILLDSI